MGHHQADDSTGTAPGGSEGAAVDARRRLEEEAERLRTMKQGISEVWSTDEPERAALGELSSYDQHPADIATDVFEREKELSIAEQLDAQLRDVDDALRRLEAGTYGRCEHCGRAIDPARLEALPATRFCKDDQEAVERDMARAIRAPAPPGGGASLPETQEV